MSLSIQNSPIVYTRIAGIFYLLIIITGILGQIFIRGSLVDPADAELTMNNIAASSTLWRSGIVVDLLMHIFDIPLMVILYFLFKPVNKLLALLGLAFNLIQTAVLVSNKLTLVLPLLMLAAPEYQAAFTPIQIQAQMSLLLNMHNHGFALGLIFFGFACSVYGYLLFNSSYFPKFIGMLVALAGSSYLIYSFTLFMAPAYAGYASGFFGFCLLGEVSFCLWLLFKGVDINQWKMAQQRKSNE